MRREGGREEGRERVEGGSNYNAMYIHAHVHSKINNF